MLKVQSQWQTCGHACALRPGWNRLIRRFTTQDVRRAYDDVIIDSDVIGVSYKLLYSGSEMIRIFSRISPRKSPDVRRRLLAGSY